MLQEAAPGQGDLLAATRSRPLEKQGFIQGTGIPSSPWHTLAGDAIGAFLVPFIPPESVDAEPGFQ